MSKKELEDKLKRKNLQIKSQIALLDEYRNTIKFLESKIFRLEEELSKLHQPPMCHCRKNLQSLNVEICDKCYPTDLA